MSWKFDRKIKRWRVRFTDERGHDTKIVMPEGSDEAMAKQRFVDEMQKVADIKAGRAVRDPNPEQLTVAGVAALWLDTQTDRERKTVTCHVIETPLGAERIERVTSARITKHLDALKPSTKIRARKEKLAPGTLNHVRKYLVAMYEWASDRGLFVGVNPVRKVKQRKVKRKSLLTLTPEEIARLLPACQQLPPTKHQPGARRAVRRERTFMFAAMVACGLLGLRYGEIVGLDIVDVDTQRWLLHVKESKNGRERYVPIHPAYRALLQQALDFSTSTVLFPGRKGKRRGKRTKNVRELRAALALAGIDKPKFRFHDLRHTCATLMIQGGATLVHVKDVLGHATIAITVDTYGHLVTEDLRVAVDRMQVADVEPRQLITREPAARKASA